MKILDNKKDYYDYLMGVYGIDTKIFYDRRKSKTYDYFCKETGITSEEAKTIDYMKVRVGQIEYTIFKNKETGKWVCPAEVEIDKGYETYTQENPHRTSDPFISPVSISFYVNRPSIWNEPIYYSFDNPILSSFPAVINFIPATTVWDEVYNFISAQYDKPIVDTRTEKQKIESAGFDTKTSFRKM